MPDEEANRTILDRFFDYVNVGLARDIEEVKSACPPRKKKSAQLPEQPKDKNPPEPDVKSTRPQPCPKESYVSPSQICPKLDPSCCYIKMQDPVAPCCCETRPRPQPCPEKRSADEPREPTCGCDRCKRPHAEPGRFGRA